MPCPRSLSLPGWVASSLRASRCDLPGSRNCAPPPPWQPPCRRASSPDAPWNHPSRPHPADGQKRAAPPAPRWAQEWCRAAQSWRACRDSARRWSGARGQRSCPSAPGPWDAPAPCARARHPTCRRWRGPPARTLPPRGHRAAPGERGPGSPGCRGLRAAHRNPRGPRARAQCSDTAPWAPRLAAPTWRCPTDSCDQTAAQGPAPRPDRPCGDPLSP